MPYVFMLALFGALVLATSGDFQKVRAAVEAGDVGAAVQHFVAEAGNVIRENDPKLEERRTPAEGGPKAR